MSVGKPDFRLPKSARLTRRSEIQRVLDRGEKRVTRHVVVFQLCVPSSPGGALPRLGLIASRKVGNAHKRNRAKRLLREVFRLHRGWFGPGEEVVFLAKRGVDGLCLQDVEKELRGVLKPERAGYVLGDSPEVCPMVS